VQRGPKTANAKTEHGREDTEGLHREGAQRSANNRNDDLHAGQDVKSTPDFGGRTARKPEDSSNRDNFTSTARD